MITVVSVGKKHNPDLKQAIEGYSKRLTGFYRLEWKLIPPSQQEPSRAALNEEKAILASLPSNAWVILLDETGQNLTSPQLSQKLLDHADRPIFLVIGGAFGVSKAVFKRADLVWSLSKLVFPHQLVRLIVTEQIYRAQTIANGHPYHHN